MSSIESLASVQELHEQYAPLGELLAIASDITKSKDAIAELISDGPVTAAAAEPSFADLVAALNDATKGPSTEVAKGNVPMPQNVTIMPPYDEPGAKQNYDHLQEMSSIVSLYTAVWQANARMNRGHPEPYNITIATEAAQAFADMANSAYTVMVGPLAGFFNFTAGTQTTFSKKMTKTDVHLEFLGELFKGFSLTKPALAQLDGILTNFIKSLGTISVETGRTGNTVDQTLRIHQVIRLNISGDETNPVWVFQPRTRIVYMHIDASTWRWATKKAEHNENTFNMRYVIVDCDLNVNKYLASRNELDKVFTKISGKSMAEYGKLINPEPVNPDKS